ncbi:MAG: redoxin domain-containing protein [Anaerolineales bacterium]|nr:redoxin domain-containing protein [Chloroflexota bacterium]MBL6982926.1 redoxin domain-containing protein [Anaerolineales bacterium]
MQNLLVDKKYIFMLALLMSLTLLLSACASAADLQVGGKAPDFLLQSAQGNQISNADYSGQPVLLYFHMAMG